MFSRFGLHERLLQALEALELREPTPIQEAMIPAALIGRDLQASAETGSGKTAAFLLPLLERMLDDPARGSATRGLVLLPTRELAQQIFKQFEALARFTHLKAGLLVGGASLVEQKALVRRNPEVLIGTPGRLREHVELHSVDFSGLEVLVLDEADRMLDMGFREDVLRIVRACNPARQTLLLSATLRHEGIGRIANEVLREPEIIALGSHRQEHALIRQQAVLADDNAHKRQLATWLLANEDWEKALVFCNTRDTVDEVAAFLKSQKQRAAALHGELPQDERKRIMGLFRSGGVKVLVATDLAARGIDVPGVDLVLNFALARSGDEHVHRCGRTGRAGRQGRAISLVSPQEWNRLEAIERYLSLRFERRVVPGMEARFQGAAAKKRKKEAPRDKLKDKSKDKPQARAAQDKSRERHRVRKNIGKRRQPSATPPAAPVPGEAAGLTPLRRKPGKDA